MADRAIIEGNFPDGQGFRFSLDGVATYDQMERLIDITEQATGKKGAPSPADRKHNAAMMAASANINKNNASVAGSTRSFGDLNDKIYDTQSAFSLLRGNFSSLSGVLRGVNNPLMMLGGAATSLVGALMGYAESLRPALQRGIGGQVMDFAIYAKSAGITMDQFNKALAASEGTFGMLGKTQNEAAKNFSGLINSVRTATASVGNLGMNNEEMAKFTAEQVKIAVQQGVRRNAAEKRVIEVARQLGKDLDELSGRTGKTTAELAQMATKLVTDPMISNYIASFKNGGDAISKAMQGFGSSMGALFGKTGEELASAAARTAVAGMPIQMDAMAEGIMTFMPTYTAHLEDMARRVANGYTPTEDDRRKLKQVFEQEYNQRRDLLAQRELIGSAEEKAAAARINQMAQAMRQYDTEDSKKRQQEASAAQKFNAQVNQLTATMHQLMVPLLEVLNSINWNAMFDMLQGAATTVKTIVENVLNPIATVLDATGLGHIAGGLLGIATVAAMVVSAFSILKGGALALAGIFRMLAGRGAAGAAAAAGTAARTGTGAAGTSAGAAAAARQAAIDSATEARKPIIERANELRKSGLSREDALKQAREEHLRNMGSGMQGQAKREAFIQTEAEGRRARAEQLKPAAPEPTRMQNFGNKTLDFIKAWGPAIAGIAGTMVGNKIASEGEKKLQEDPEDKLAKAQVLLGETISFAGTWGGLLFTMFPNLIGNLKSFGSATLDLATKHFPGLVDGMGKFSNSLKDWGTKFLGSAAGKTAAAAGVAVAGSWLLDAGLGKLGVGKDAQGKDKEVDKKQDDANWDRMNWWQKIESGTARLIEGAGNLVGASNMAREAEIARIRDETAYFEAKDQLERTAAGASDRETRQAKEMTDQLKILNKQIEEMNDKADVNTGIQFRNIMNSEDHTRYLRALTLKPN